LLRNQWRGWDHLKVLLLLVYRLVRGLFGLLAALARSDLSKDAELLVLRHENQVLRRQLGGRLRWDHADRLWLAALSRHLVAPKWDHASRRRPGRPSTGASVKTLIIRIARENPAWGPPHAAPISATAASRYRKAASPGRGRPAIAPPKTRRRGSDQ
jgi:hypothetical protein